MRFDLIILGDTPDAWAAAEDAALLGRQTLLIRTAPIDNRKGGGVAAVLATFGIDASATRGAGSPLRDLWVHAVQRHFETIKRIACTSDVSIARGPMRFLGPDAIEADFQGEKREVSADSILIATGTLPRRPRGLPFDGRVLFVPEDVPNIRTRPRSLVVLGGNRTACAYARMFLAAGSDVRMIDGQTSNRSTTNLSQINGDVLDMRCSTSSVCIRLTNGRVIDANAVLFATDRVGATASLDLAAAGLEADEDGRLWCDETGQTWVPTIHAAGEVVGYPRQLRETPWDGCWAAMYRNRRSAAGIASVGHVL